MVERHGSSIRSFLLMDDICVTREIGDRLVPLVLLKFFTLIALIRLSLLQHVLCVGEKHLVLLVLRLCLRPIVDV